MNPDWINALFGGALIGVAVSLMLYWNGRVTGISGIINGILAPAKGDALWRVMFVAGLFVGGLAMGQMNPQAFTTTFVTETWVTVIAGLLVGFGTILGSGCTSGHGVCGISRLSPRSIAATMLFIAAGVLAVTVFKKMGVIL